MNKLVIELTTKYDDGDMKAKVYEERTDNAVIFDYVASKKEWVLGFGKIDNKKVNKRTNNELLNRMKEFFDNNKNSIISKGVIFEGGK